MPIKIYWATSNDIKDLVQLDIIAHKENKFWKPQSKSQFGKIIKSHKCSTLIARIGKESIGYLQSGVRNTTTHVWLENIFVLKEFRKKKIAKMLVGKFVGYWRKHTKYVVLITEDKNLKIFEKLGFEKEMNYMGYKFVKTKRN